MNLYHIYIKFDYAESWDEANNAHIIRCVNEDRCRKIAADLAQREGPGVWLDAHFSNVDLLIKHDREQVLLTSFVGY